MKRFRACFLAASLAFIFGSMIDSFNPNTIAKNEVLDLTFKLNKAYLENDRKFISEIHAESVLFTRYKFERVVSKDELLANLDFRLLLDLKAIQILFVFVEVDENNASVSFWQTCTFKSENGEDIKYIGQEILTFEKQQGEWKIVSIYVE